MDKGNTIKVLDHGFVRYIDHMGTDERIVEAARISYKSPSKGPEQDKKLLHYLYKNSHNSPFEQCSITFNIKLPLFVQGQMVRHRTQRLNQVSARYTEMPDEFYIPSEWRKQEKSNKQGSLLEPNWNPDLGYLTGDLSSLNHNGTATGALMACCEISYAMYETLIKAGVAREMARMVLPQNLYTEIYSNWDIRNLMHFFKLRLDLHSQVEVREFAKAMYQIFAELFPWTAEAYNKYQWKLVD